MDGDDYTTCLFCDLRRSISFEILEKGKELASVDKRVHSLEDQTGELAARLVTIEERGEGERREREEVGQLAQEDGG